MKKLIIFSGGGDPFLSYKKVYDLIKEMSKKCSYSECSVVNWPGHFSFDDTSTMTLKNALPIAQDILKKLEEGNQPYDIIARSFGCSVFLKTYEDIELKKLGKVVLWGPPPFYILYELFKNKLEKQMDIGLTKNVRISPDFISETYPFEYLVSNFSGSIPLRIATGQNDQYCLDFHLSFYNKINKYIDTVLVKNIGHEVSDYNDDYFNALFK